MKTQPASEAPGRARQRAEQGNAAVRKNAKDCPEQQRQQGKQHKAPEAKHARQQAQDRHMLSGDPRGKLAAEDMRTSVSKRAASSSTV